MALFLLRDCDFMGQLSSFIGDEETSPSVFGFPALFRVFMTRDTLNARLIILQVSVKENKRDNSVSSGGVIQLKK